MNQKSVCWKMFDWTLVLVIVLIVGLSLSIGLAVGF